MLPGREGDLFSVDAGLVGCCGDEGGGIDPEDDRGIPDRAVPLGSEGPGAGDGRLVYLSKGEGEAGVLRQGLEGSDFGEDPACGRIDEVRPGEDLPDPVGAGVVPPLVEGGIRRDPAVDVDLDRGFRGVAGAGSGDPDYVPVAALGRG